jgi:hypothetical protein
VSFKRVLLNTQCITITTEHDRTDIYGSTSATAQAYTAVFIKQYKVTERYCLCTWFTSKKRNLPLLSDDVTHILSLATFIIFWISNI